MNPPDLKHFGGDWVAYEADIYSIFVAELANGALQYEGLRVGCRRHPETEGKWASFWHLVQEGRVEEERLPDLRRCERIRWVRWVIENAQAHADIDVWQNKRGSEVNALLWYREEYIVILGERRGYWLLRTAYCTDQNGRVAKLRKERDAFLSSNP